MRFFLSIFLVLFMFSFSTAFAEESVETGDSQKSHFNVGLKGMVIPALGQSENCNGNCASDGMEFSGGFSLFLEAADSPNFYVGGEVDFIDMTFVNIQDADFKLLNFNGTMRGVYPINKWELYTRFSGGLSWTGHPDYDMGLGFNAQLLPGFSYRMDSMSVFMEAGALYAMWWQSVTKSKIGHRFSTLSMLVNFGISGSF